MEQPRIVVIGAGLAGSCVALDLARRGLSVAVLEREAEPLLRASLRNEGKIHLGFVYALDPSGATRQRMLEGALSFAPILERLCGPLPWRDWCSEGFRYAVMPDTLAGPGVLEEAYDDLRDRLARFQARGGASRHYLGRALGDLWRRSGGRRGRPRVGGAPVEVLYETEEVSVDPRPLARVVSSCLRSEPRAELRCGVEVLGARRRSGGKGLALEVATREGGSTVEADIVVNCSWADRLRLDRAVGLRSEGGTPCFRVKYQVIVRPRRPVRELAPVTMVQGPYGDLVPWRDGEVYLSWYPLGRTYFGSEPPPPPSEPSVEARRVARATLGAMSELFPALAGSEIVSALPGVIFARGSSDVDDPASGLHVRAAPEVEHHDGWWSVDTGKLTTAPLVAARVAERVAREIGVGVA